MKIKSITFRKNILGGRSIRVKMSGGKVYKVKRSGAYAVVYPPCSQGETEALQAVYRAVWEYLNGEKVGCLDRGAKVACGRLVTLLDWPEGSPEDTEARLRYIVEKITNREDIF